MCGILGLILANTESLDAAPELHEALYILQHRGQDACGITVCGSKGRFFQCKDNGMASSVFNIQRVQQLQGYMGIGHLRYPTAGSSANAEAQPFYVNSPYGISFSHNGNLVNAPQLKKYLDEVAHRHINTDSDSELMLNTFANELNETGKVRVNEEDIFAALSRMYDRCSGGWACTAMLAGFGIIGFRDPHGIRPLVIGSRPSRDRPGKKDWMMASESVVLDMQGFSEMRDVLPGQAVVIPKDTSEPIFRTLQPRKAYTPDIFEYVYFARPDSIIDGISVAESRERMGVKLAATIRERLTAAELDEIDAVVPIPETAVTSTFCVANALKKPFCEGFVKNRYVFRTFIMPGQKLREKSVRRKLNPMRVKFEGKNVLLIDDSIVRGTTSREIVTMARDAGAVKVYFASCAPRITDPHIYGIDLASKSELIGSHRNETDIAKHIGAEKVIYQSLDDLKDACRECESQLPPDQDRPTEFEVGVFCGKYVTPVDDGYFEHLDRIRGESKRLKVMEQARHAVAIGVAGRTELDMARNGTTVDEAGAVVPKLGDSTSNGHLESERTGEERSATPNGMSSAGHQMDISLHNIADSGLERR